MDSFGKPYVNAQLEYLERQITEKKSRIPKGRRKTITCWLSVNNYNIFYINLVLKKYPNAMLMFSDLYGRPQCRILNGSIHINDFNKICQTEFGGVLLRFRFICEGVSENFSDKLNPSNWFLEKVTPVTTPVTTPVAVSHGEEINQNVKQ